MGVERTRDLEKGERGQEGPEAHSENSHQRPLQEPHKDVTPVVFVVRHAGVAHVEGKGHQEELHRGPQQPCPLPAEPCLHIQLGARGRPLAQEPVALTPHPLHRWQP